MSEFYRNISIQALSTLNNETELEFYHATQLIKNINFDFQINVYENKLATQKLGNKNYWQLKLQLKPELKFLLTMQVNKSRLPLKL